MAKAKPSARKVTNKKFKEPEWYVSLAVDALDFKFASLAKNLGKSLSPEVEDTSKELLNIYQLAFNRTLKAMGIDQKIKSLKSQEKLFFEHIIDPDFPSFHPVFHHFVDKLDITFSGGATTESSEDWSIDRNSLRREFSQNLNSIIQAGSGKHKNAINYIYSLREYVEPKESQVIAHMNSVLEEVEYDVLAIDPELTLRKSYVTPSAILKHVSLLSKKENKKIEEDNLLNALIDQLDKSCLPIVIHGQPGHGKTSSVKMLVTALSQLHQHKEIPVSILFYEFKTLRSLNNPIFQVLNTETNFIDGENFFYGKNTVLILDGLDERQIADGSDEALKGFVAGLFRLSESVNKKGNCKLNIILTGRSQFVGQIQSCFNTDHFVYEIKDFNKAQIILWLERFNKQKSNSDNVTIQDLEKFHLNELISQPILLSISSIMLSDNEGKKLLRELDSSKINRSQIYKTIIQWSYEKKWQKSPNASSLRDELNFDNYFILLQAIAFEMFNSGQENIKLSKLALDLSTSNFDLDFIENKDVSHIEQLCSQLRISFFFKGVEDKAFSFIHKSIKDFLIVSGIVDSLLLLLTDCNVKKLDKESNDLYRLLGGNYLSSEDHIPMLDEWIAHRKDQMTFSNNKLIPIWERIGSGDFPITFDNAEQAMYSHSCILINYYQIISRHFSRSSTAENKKIFGNAKVILFNTSFGDETSNNRTIPFDVFTTRLTIFNDMKLCFSNQILKIRNPNTRNLYFVEHDFSRCIIQASHLHQSVFYGCNFSSAKFVDNWMIEAVFENCNFDKSELELLCNAGRTSGEKGYLFNNKFIECRFSHSLLKIEKDKRYGYKEKYYLFLDCNLDSARINGKENCTIKYIDY